MTEQDKALLRTPIAELIRMGRLQDGQNAWDKRNSEAWSENAEARRQQNEAKQLKKEAA